MDLAIVGMNSTGIDLYQTMKNEVDELHLLGQAHEPGMALHGQGIMLERDDLHEIISIVNENIKSECLIYITNDIYYDLVMNEYGRTETWFNDNIKYFGVSHEFYSRMRDKKKYERFLASYRMISPQNYDHEKDGAVPLPVIAKYNGLEHENYQYKSRVITTRDEWEVERAREYAGSYIFQKYYPPDEYLQFSYGCFVDRGKIIADIYVRQLGQYPQGVSTLVVEDGGRPADFICAVERLLKEEEYDGFIEFEILKSDRETVVIDLNPRPWGWFYILNFKYRNFSELACLKSKVPAEVNKRRRVWVNYSRLSAGLLKGKSFGVLKHVRLNRSFLNSLLFVYLTLRQRTGGRVRR